VPAELTVLTGPISARRITMRAVARAALRTLRARLTLKPGRPKYGGHFAVTRSAVEGLRNIGVRCNHDPSRLDELGTTVVVLSSIDALRQAIEWKRSGRIRRLLAGPNLVLLPSDVPEVVTAPEIDVYLVNSEWTRAAYVADAPALAGRCEIWPAGVDVGAFAPADRPGPRTHALLYEKTEPLDLVERCRGSLEASGYAVTSVRYGSYKPDEYLRKLRGSRLAVFFSRAESQGIALAEAWAVDVPTLVWDPGFLELRGRRVCASSAPYLTSSTGRFFRDEAEFDAALDGIERDAGSLSPRRWVVENMSDEACARKLCEVAGFVVGTVG
jgi:hypothetical protein